MYLFNENHCNLVPVDNGTAPRPTTSQDQPQQQQTSRSDSNAEGGTAPSAANNFFTDGSAFPRQFPFPFMIPPMPSFIPGTFSILNKRVRCCEYLSTVFFSPQGMFIPPLPPQNWTGLSVEELRLMEDTGRQGVEARLQCLRNIHTLMDASVILMQQYITSATIAAAASTAATAAASSSSGSQTTVDGSSSTTSSNSTETDVPSESTPTAR